MTRGAGACAGAGAGAAIDDDDDWCVIEDTDTTIARGWGKSLFASRDATRVDRLLLKKLPTRAEAKQALEDGRVTMLDDGAVVTKGNVRVDGRRVLLDGEALA